MARQLTSPAWNALERTLTGEVVLPGSPDHQAASTPRIPRFDPVWPAAVVRCRTQEDVASTLAFARRWLAGSWPTVHPWGTGGVYPNFPDPDLEDPPRAYHPEDWVR